MATAPVTDAELQETVNTRAKYNTVADAAASVKMPYATFAQRLKMAQHRGIKPVGAEPPETKIKRLEQALKAAEAESADAKVVKSIIGRTAEKASEIDPPAWLERASNKPSSPGVPTLLLSDFHWGEVVHPGQINGVNQYNLRIAHERLNNCVDSAVDLLKIISPRMDYPGIVVPLAGDMVSGDIHEELTISNELPTIPVVLDLLTELIRVVRRCADTFGAVFLPCVTGNHGRNTHKIRAKDRHHTSFDWLLYQLLARHFEGDKRVTFFIPDGPDAYYKIYGTRYLCTHLDQFRGGDGLIGHLGPLVRGDHKKRSRNAQIDLAYDVMIGGHWHTYSHLTRLIVNGSLKGYDEYAYSNNFGFETPQQALWITHLRHGITFRMPVYCDRRRAAPKTDWVSVPK